MTNKQRTLIIGGIVALTLLAIVVPQTIFTVDERQLAVLVRFGDPIASYREKDTGMHFKAPFIDEVRYFPRTYQFWTGAQGEVLENLPTADGNKLEITPWAIWRITDPEQFLEVMRNTDEAQRRVKQFVRGGVRDVITNNDLNEVVRDEAGRPDTDREMDWPIEAALPPITEDVPQAEDGDDASEAIKDAIAGKREIEPIEIGRAKLVEMINDNVDQQLRQSEETEGGGRGIELIEVGIAKVDFVDSVRESAFDRLIARLESTAARYTNEGMFLNQEIINRANAEVQKIEGEGKEEANTTRGKVEAEIIEKYAAAIEQTGEFYNFIRMLEAYKLVLGKDTRLVMTTDSEMFRLLKELPPLDALPTPADVPDEAAAEPEPPE